MEKYSVLNDPRGLIFEAYKIEGITSEDCRSIFFDWALGLSEELNVIQELTTLYEIYAKSNPNHPMSKVIKEGLCDHKKKQVRGRRRQSRI